MGIIEKPGRSTTVSVLRVVGLCLLALASMGSMCAAQESDLLKRASFDLSCPEGSIQTTELGSGTKGVQGCGKKATYVEKCTGQPGNMLTTCGWVLNNTDAPAK